MIITFHSSSEIYKQKHHGLSVCQRSGTIFINMTKTGDTTDRITYASQLLIRALKK